jgi:glycosyltransferase involved in cell wall biosynthesis
MKILFLVPYPPKEAPSQRFRFEQYFDVLANHNFTIEVESFLPPKDWKVFYEKGGALKKCVLLVKGFLRRFRSLFTAAGFDFVFIHREVTPIGPPLFEWILAKLLKKKIIYDFDDAIWMTDRIDESFMLKSLKCRWKVSAICSWSYKVSCGNQFLCSYAKAFNQNVVLNPTTIDTESQHNVNTFPKVESSKITIGWTGSHSTIKYLDIIETVFGDLEKRFSNVEFVVIADKAPSFTLKSLKFLPWSSKTEIQDLNTIDIGIMPLPNDDWSKGKCGFKALQYMALEIPTVASPVGVNKQIIHHGEDGFLAADSAEWIQYLSALIMDHDLRTMMGQNARKKIEKQYSKTSNVKNFLSLFAHSTSALVISSIAAIF